MPAVSEKQRRAMFAAANGHSTLGIPKAVGKEFVGKDADFEESKHPRASNGQFGSGGGTAAKASKATTYKPGKVSFSDAAPDEADETEEHELEDDAGTVMYDVSYVTDGDTIHAVVSGAEIENADGERVPIDSLGRVQAYKLRKTIAASVEGHVESRAEEETEGSRWDNLTDEEQAAETEARERAAAEADRTKTQEIDRDVDALLVSGWKPEFNNFGGLHAGKTPDQIKQYASPKSMEKILMRLREKGFKPPVREAAQDSIALDRASVRRIDQDGHLHVEMTPISKANVCGYVGREIPDFQKLGLDASKTYQLYRDADELARAAPTFAGKPLMLIHKPVSADDHPREITVGSVGDDVVFDAPYLMAPLHVVDGEAIGLINSDEQRQLSSAYRYRADMTPGTVNGEAYDGVMRDIVGNHVALVREGRAGPDVIVGDSKRKASMPFDFAAFDAKPDYGALFEKHRQAGETSEQTGARKSAGELDRHMRMSGKERQAEREKEKSSRAASQPRSPRESSKELESAMQKKRGGSSAGKTKHDPSSGKFTGDADPLEKLKAFLADKLSPEDLAKIDDLCGSAMQGAQDSKETNMSTMTHKASVTRGALMAYLAPKLAQDATVDLRPALVGITAKNFVKKRPAIIAAVTRLTDGKLAKDAKLDELEPILMALDAVESEEDDKKAEDETEDMPKVGGGKGKGPGDGKAKDKKAMDRKKARDEARESVKESLKDKLSAEDWKTACDDIDGMEAEDDDDPEDERTDPERTNDAKGKKAKDAEPMVSKKAMDEAIASDRQQERQRQRDVRDAERFVRPWIGDLAVAYDSAEEVYKAALEARGKSAKGIHPSAYRTILEMLPKPGTENRPARDRLGMDAVNQNAKSFDEMYPGAMSIRLNA